MNLLKSNILVDTEFHWKGFGNGFGDWDSYCRIRIVDMGESLPHLVLATDLGGDTGTSITNSAEHLATLFTAQYGEEYGLNENTSWIHHHLYLPKLREYSEDFSLVQFHYRDGCGSEYSAAKVVFLRPNWISLIAGYSHQGSDEGSNFVYERNRRSEAKYGHLIDVCQDLSDNPGIKRLTVLI